MVHARPLKHQLALAIAIAIEAAILDDTSRLRDFVEVAASSLIYQSEDV